MAKKIKSDKILVFTDGSCSGNGKKYAVGGIGVHFPNGELEDLSRPFTLGVCTNQRTELYAILVALKYIKSKLGLSKKEIVIKTDSMYSINCVTKWVYRWIENSWKTQKDTPVVNRELIEPIFKMYEKYDITLEYTEGHSGGSENENIANDTADQLARDGTEAAKKLKKPTRSPSKTESTRTRTRHNTNSHSEIEAPHKKFHKRTSTVRRKKQDTILEVELVKSRR